MELSRSGRCAPKRLVQSPQVDNAKEPKKEDDMLKSLFAGVGAMIALAPAVLVARAKTVIVTAPLLVGCEY